MSSYSKISSQSSTMVFLAPDQKSIRIVRLLTVTEEIVPLFRVPEALLSDRGANLLSHLMSDPDLADPVVEISILTLI